MLELTPEEMEICLYRSNYERICAPDILDWSSEGRWIGRLLLVSPEGMTISEMARATGLSRSTVRRRVNKMIEGKAARVNGTVVIMTDTGRAFWITLYREMDAISRGHKVGLSAPLLVALRGSGLLSESQLAALGAVSFPTIKHGK